MAQWSFVLSMQVRMEHMKGVMEAPKVDGCLFGFVLTAVYLDGGCRKCAQRGAVAYSPLRIRMECTMSHGKGEMEAP